MTETRRWIRIARCEDIPLREGRSVKLGVREIAIFNLGDRFLAVASHCPHKNGPLAEGIISGQSVVCPLHAWKLDLETGAVTRPTDTLACVERFPVRVEHGVILVELATQAHPNVKSQDCGAELCASQTGHASAHLRTDDSELGNMNL